MKVACLQFSPVLGRREENIQRAEEIIVAAMPTQGAPAWDWLILPEMAFSGYSFKTAEDIKPFLEDTTSGRTTEWAQLAASRLGCHITVGYPEKSKEEPRRYYNSTVTVSPTGEVLLNYRKSFLYYTDETWASEGPGFFHGKLDRLGHVSHGICMDINPYRFTAEFTAFEFAKAAMEAKTPMVVLSMAWLTHLTPEELKEKAREADNETLFYWMERMRPIITQARDEKVTMVFANRCGQEDATCYAGSSAVIRADNGKLSIVDMLGRSEEKCMVVDTDATAKYELQFRS